MKRSLMCVVMRAGVGMGLTALASAADGVPPAAPAAEPPSVEEAVEELEGAALGLWEALRERARGAVEEARAEAGAAIDAAADASARPAGVFVLSDLLGAEELEWVPIGEVAAAPERVVLLVHGLDEPGSIWDDLAPALRDAGFAVARFEYPNDQGIAASADLLAASLRDLRSRGVERVDLVCHSMGGLVARDVLTREGMYGGTGRGVEGLPEVRRLILLGTPNLGSAWAAARGVTEVREHVWRWIEEGADDPRLLLGGLRDGSGAAGRDLKPGSAFLTELNARPLPEGVAITTVVAVAAGVAGEGEDGSPGTADPLGLEGLEEASWLRRFVSEEELERVRAAAAAVVGGVGDGVVSVESARLAGVEDVVEVEGNHRGMVRRIEILERVKGVVGGEREEPPAIGVVLERLGRE